MAWDHHSHSDLGIPNKDNSDLNQALFYDGNVRKKKYEKNWDEIKSPVTKIV